MFKFYFSFLFLCTYIIVFAQNSNLRLGLPIGHISGINTANFSPDGKYIVTSSNDYTACVWNVETGKLINLLKGHRGSVYHAMFNPNSQDNSLQVLTVSNDKSIKLWDAITGKIIINIENAHLSSIYFGTFSPDGEKIITVSFDRTAKIWETSSGKLLHHLTKHTGRVTYATFSNDSKKVVTTSYDRTAKMWDVDSGELIMNFYGHIGKVLHAQLNPISEYDSKGNKYLLTSSDDNSVKYWEVETGKLKYSFEYHSDFVNMAIFSPNGKFILTSFDKTAKIIDSKNGNLIYSLNKHSYKITHASINYESNRIITASQDGTVIIWDAITGKLIHEIKAHQQEINYVFFKPTKNNVFQKSTFISASSDKTAKIWDLENGSLLKNLTSSTSIVNLVSISKNKKKLAIVINNEEIEIRDLKNGKLIDKIISNGKKINNCQFNTNDSKLLIVYENFTYKVLNTVNYKEISENNLQDKTTLRVKFHIDGNSIITEHTRNQIKNIDLITGKTISEKTSNFNLELVKDDELILENLYYTIGKRNNIEIRNIDDNSLVVSFEGHKGIINTVKYIKNKNILITTSDDETVKIWCFETKKLLYNLTGHTSSVISSEITSDGKLLVTSSLDGSYIFWDLDKGKKIFQNFIFNNDQMVSVIDNGLFDATENTMSLMYWIKGNEIIEFNQLKNRYWEPDLWKKIMNNEHIRDVGNLNILKSPPEIIIDKIQDNKLLFKIIKKDGGYGKISIKINGKEVEADASDLIFSKDDHTNYLSYDLTNQPLLINDYENIIEIKPWNEEGYIEGRGAIVVHKTENKKELIIPQFYGVICGVSEYVTGNINLRYAEPDAIAITNAIKLGASNLFGDNNTHIYTITSPGKIIPNKKNIQAVFEEISKKAKPEDIFFIYLSGHGITWGGELGDFHYLTYDAFSSSADAFNDPIIRKNTTINTAEFTEWIKQIAALKQVMIIDACGSGKAVDNLINERNVESSQIRAIDRMKDRTGMFVISGCAADAVSYEASKYGHGLLTYTILEGIKGAAVKEDNFLDINNILSYAREQVPILATGIGGIQEPQLLIPKKGSFDIGILDIENRKNIKLPQPKKIYLNSNFMNIDEFEDNLNIAKAVDEFLLNVSDNKTTSNILFLKINDFPDGCKISGNYKKKNKDWILKGKINCEKNQKYFSIKSKNVVELKEKLLMLIKSYIN